MMMKVKKFSINLFLKLIMYAVFFDIITTIVMLIVVFLNK